MAATKASPRFAVVRAAPEWVDEAEAAPAVLDVEVPLSALALAWKAAKLFGPLSIALAEKTMPCPQWFA
jgi:hypothetical protein